MTNRNVQKQHISVTVMPPHKRERASQLRYASEEADGFPVSIVQEPDGAMRDYGARRAPTQSSNLF